MLTRNEEAQLGAIIHLGSAVKRAQQQLQADDGTEPSLDEVGISHSPTLNDSALSDRVCVSDEQTAHDSIPEHLVPCCINDLKFLSDCCPCFIHRLHGI